MREPVSAERAQKLRASSALIAQKKRRSKPASPGNLSAISGKDKKAITE